MIMPADVRNAGKNGDVERVRTYLAEGGDANALSSESEYPFTLLFSVCSQVDVKQELLKLLLDHGARIHPVSITHAAACHCQNHKTVATLLRYGADPSPENHGWTALHAAALGWNHELVKILLDGGADVNRCLSYELSEGSITTDPPTPLLCAASSCQSVEIVRLLLSRGAHINAVSGPSPVSFYSHWGVFDYVRDALRQKAPRDHAPDPDGDQSWPYLPDEWRLPGEVEDVRSLLTDVVDAGGSWSRYVNEPRIQLLVLQMLCVRGRASPPAGVSARLYALPTALLWYTLSFWRTPRDVGAAERSPRAYDFPDE